MKTVVIINSNSMGRPNVELGQKILGVCLAKLPNHFKQLSAIVLYNTGVELVKRDSPVLGQLKSLHDSGVDILPCGTCVQYLGLGGQIAFEASNMAEILTELAAAEKVITL